MKKKTYIIVFGALCLSACLLGFSYARESGTNQETFLNQDKSDNLRVIYSSSTLSTEDEDGTDVSIINHSNKEVSAVLVLEPMSDMEIKDTIYYSINDGDVKKLSSLEISLGTLSNYGMNGDQGTYNIKISSKGEDVIYYNISIKKEERKYLLDVIRENGSVYVDGSYLRFYGSNVNNYIKYDNNIYRIIGDFNGKLRITTLIGDESNYETALNNGTLLSLDDYLHSFTSNAISEEDTKNMSSWLKEQQYWLQDSKDGRGYVASLKLGLYTDDNSKLHNNRYIKEIDSKCYYVAGDGSYNSPYEVSYGS